MAICKRLKYLYRGKILKYGVESNSLFLPFRVVKRRLTNFANKKSRTEKFGFEKLRVKDRIRTDDL